MPRRTRRPEVQLGTDRNLTDDGALHAMDHVGTWVRFADMKATILAAGLGVILTMLMTNADTIAAAIEDGGTASGILIAVTAATTASAAWTLIWIVRAITPRTGGNTIQSNRFAWPSLSGASADQLSAHLVQTSLQDDGWRQALVLATIADQKFAACTKAVWGFAAFVILASSCVGMAVVIAV